MLQELKAKLLSQIEIVEGDCWEWKGCCGSHGYGQLTFKWKVW